MPDVFWAVIAVIADVPYTPSAAKVLRSAWMPAPAIESLPAIVRTARIGPLLSKSEEILVGEQIVVLTHELQAGYLCGFDDRAGCHTLFRIRAGTAFPLPMLDDAD